MASLFVTDTPTPEPLTHDDPDAFGVRPYISAPPEPAFVGAGAPIPVDHRSPIDWTGQGGRVDERVTSSDDILRVSEATALPGRRRDRRQRTRPPAVQGRAHLPRLRLIGVGAIASRGRGFPVHTTDVLVVGAGPAGSAAATMWRARASP